MNILYEIKESIKQGGALKVTPFVVDLCEFDKDYYSSAMREDAAKDNDLVKLRGGLIKAIDYLEASLELTGKKLKEDAFFVSTVSKVKIRESLVICQQCVDDLEELLADSDVEFSSPIGDILVDAVEEETLASEEEGGRDGLTPEREEEIRQVKIRKFLKNEDW